MIQPIVKAPDKVLSIGTLWIRDFDQKFQTLVDSMIETMLSIKGVGLAAPQVGIPLRVCVIKIPEEQDVRVLVNPKVVARRGTREMEEACLSIPGYYGAVTRARQVRVHAFDRMGKPIRLRANDNLLAQVIEHEVDHLYGILYTAHLVEKDGIWPI